MTAKWLKILAAMLALCTVMTATGCNDDKESSDSGTAEATSEVSTEEAEPLAKVGYIYHGDVDDNGFTAEINGQRLKASQHSDIESVYIENVTISDFETAVKTLVEYGCTHVVACHPVYTNILTTTAGKYMNVDFIGYGSRIPTVNIFAYNEQPYQAAYVAGMAAAYNSDTEKIGIVVDPDMLYSTPIVNAAALGMQLVYTNAEMMVCYATHDNEVEKAVNSLYNAGCDVIICYTETAHTADYCEEKGIDFIGCMNYTETAKDYSNMLMYFYSQRDSFFLSQFKQLTLDTWEPSEFTGTLANGVINVSQALPAAKAGTQDILNALIPKVSTEQAYIFTGELKNNSGNIMIMQSDIMEPSEIYTMEWYVQGVVFHDNFREPEYELDTNEFEIHS